MSIPRAWEAAAEWMLRVTADTIWGRLLIEAGHVPLRILRASPDVLLPESFGSGRSLPLRWTRARKIRRLGLSPVGTMFLRFSMPERLWEFAPSAEAYTASLSRRIPRTIGKYMSAVKH